MEWLCDILSLLTMNSRHKQINWVCQSSARLKSCTDKLLLRLKLWIHKNYFHRFYESSCCDTLLVIISLIYVLSSYQFYCTKYSRCCNMSNIQIFLNVMGTNQPVHLALCQNVFVRLELILCANYNRIHCTLCFWTSILSCFGQKQCPGKIHLSLLLPSC